jgi:hypothetical protein
MYCSTCGARVPEGHTRCINCGAAVSRPAGFGVPAVAQGGAVSPLATSTCPRCGFQGPTVGYFSQGSHVVGLIFLTLLTMFPAAGAGGLLYYLLRHNHRSCARCGETLGKRDVLALQASAAGGPLPAVTAAEADLPEDVGAWSSIWGIGAIVMYLFAAMFAMITVGEGEPVVAMFALFAGGAGAMLHRRARSAREDRRQALLVALQQPVLRLAGERAGRLTVTEVASSLGWPLRRAEKVLNSLEDGLRVASDVTNEGVIVYEFRELMHARSRQVTAAEMDALLIPGAQAPRPAAQAQPLPLPRDGTLSA